MHTRASGATGRRAALDEAPQSGIEPPAPDLQHLRTGETTWIPIDSIRPGQTQISFINVRSKMLDFVERIDRRRREAADSSAPPDRSLLGYDEALTAVVGPGGKYLVLTDGHHHIAALKAVQYIVNNTIGDCLARGGRISTWKPGKEIAQVQSLLGGERGIPDVPIQIVGNYSDLSESEFWERMSREHLVYLDGPTGRSAKTPPAGFGALKDNPFRYLASILTGKVQVTGDTFRLYGAEHPVWLKTIGHAAPFIEFEIARVLKRFFTKHHIEYDCNAPLTKELRVASRLALLEAKSDRRDPLHEALADLTVIVRDRPKDHLRDRLELNEDGDGVVVTRKLQQASKRRLRHFRKIVRRLGISKAR
jgi:hypothetical protein